jgi:hypothetical protein
LQDSTTFADIYRVAKERELDEEAFAQTIRRVQAAEKLAVNAASVRAAHDYLAALEGHLSAHPELDMDRQALLLQMTLDALLGPDTWPRLEAELARFKERYTTQYQKFHRDYMGELAPLRDRHRQLERKLLALQRLQSIPGIGGSGSVGLRNLWQELAGRLYPCSVAPADVSVEAQPYCATCKLPFGSTVPSNELATLEQQIEEDLAPRVSAFKRAAVQQAIRDAEQRGDALAATLAQAVTLGGDQVIAFLADAEQSAEFIRRLFAEVRSASLSVAARLRERYPTVSANDLDGVVGYFRELLVQSLKGVGEGGEIELT